MSIPKLEQWCLAQTEIESVETEIAYYPLGQGDDFSPMTEMRTSITFNDGQEWHNVARKVGGDYREDESAMNIICQTSQAVIARFLMRRTHAEENT